MLRWNAEAENAQRLARRTNLIVTILGGVTGVFGAVVVPHVHKFPSALMPLPWPGTLLVVLLALLAMISFCLACVEVVRVPRAEAGVETASAYLFPGVEADSLKKGRKSRHSRFVLAASRLNPSDAKLDAFVRVSDAAYELHRQNSLAAKRVDDSQRALLYAIAASALAVVTYLVSLGLGTL